MGLGPPPPPSRPSLQPPTFNRNDSVYYTLSCTVIAQSQREGLLSFANFQTRSQDLDPCLGTRLANLQIVLFTVKFAHLYYTKSCMDARQIALHPCWITL